MITNKDIPKEDLLWFQETQKNTKDKEDEISKDIKIFWDNVFYYSKILKIPITKICRSELRGKNVSIKMISKISKALDVPISKLFDPEYDRETEINDMEHVIKERFSYESGVSRGQIKAAVLTMEKLGKYLMEA